MSLPRLVLGFASFAYVAAAAEARVPVKDGSTPLHWAAHDDDTEAVKRLLREGANPNAVNRYGVTPLSLACTNANAAMVEFLLASGANPNAALPGGETPLMTCARTGNANAVKALLARGAAVEAKEERGQTALMWAAAEGHVDAVKALLGGRAGIHARLSSGFTPLLFAVREGHIGVASALIEAGASPNDKIQNPMTEGVRPRLAKAPRTGISALVLAVTNGHYDMAAFLLEKGADPNAAEAGYTALHVISGVRKPGGGDNDPAPRGSGRMTSLDMVKKLKEHGADLNARTSKKINFGLTGLNTTGATAFLLAARTADAELMRTLAGLGADPKIPNADGATPLIVAAGLGTRSPGEDAGTEAEVIEAMQVALELGNDIDAVDSNGETAMHGAAYKNLPGAVEFLAKKGANIAVWHKRNKYGWTPLTIAEGYRFGNYKPSPPTIEAIRKAMLAAGVQPVSEKVKGRDIY